MLGLLGNVAEVKELRPQLMTSQFISVFRLVLLAFPFFLDCQDAQNCTLCLGESQLLLA